MKRSDKTLCLVESAVMLAAATVLSMIKVLDLPYGGSVTACSALPVLLVAYRRGLRWGLGTGFSFALMQLILGAGVLSYCPTAAAAAAVILLDYLAAFTVLGLGGVFRRRLSQTGALVTGAVLTGIARYIFHVIAGCTVWAGLSIPTEAALWYSMAYNATYMVPEVLVTALGAWYLSSALDLRGDLPAAHTVAPARARLSVWAKLIIALAAAADVVLIFRHLQDAETGGWSAGGFAAVNWPAVGLVTAAAVIAVAIDRLVAHIRGEKG